MFESGTADGTVSVVETIDYHTAGEPFRIVAEPPVMISGDTVADRRARAIDDPEIDGLRQLLCSEPRGHADMYGGFIVPPDDDGADFGVLFWHKDGFSTACGHGTIALGVWAARSGRVSVDPDGVTDIRIDVPSGRVTARVRSEAGRVATVDFVSVPSYVVARELAIDMGDRKVIVDVGFGGALYAQIDAAQLGLRVGPADYASLIEAGRRIKWAVNDTAAARHRTDDRLSGIYGTIIHEHVGTDSHGRVHQRNVTVFADGEVDRSPCGSGTASRLPVLVESGVMGPDTVLLHESIVGTVFEGRLGAPTEVDGRDAWCPVVTGMAYPTGEHRFVLDADDPIGHGFVLR